VLAGARGALRGLGRKKESTTGGRVLTGDQRRTEGAKGAKRRVLQEGECQAGRQGGPEGLRALKESVAQGGVIGGSRGALRGP